MIWLICGATVGYAVRELLLKPGEAVDIRGLASVQGRVGDAFTDGPPPGWYDHGDGTASQWAPGQVPLMDDPVSYAEAWDIWEFLNSSPDCPPGETC